MFTQGPKDLAIIREQILANVAIAYQMKYGMATPPDSKETSFTILTRLAGSVHVTAMVMCGRTCEVMATSATTYTFEDAMVKLLEATSRVIDEHCVAGRIDS